MHWVRVSALLLIIVSVLVLLILLLRSRKANPDPLQSAIRPLQLGANYSGESFDQPTKSG